MEKPRSAGLFLFILFFLATMKTCSGTENLTLGCFQVERIALLKFKDSLINSPPRLSSWEGNDCCKWYGLLCDKATGHVIKLDLRSSGYVWENGFVGGDMNSCFLDLKYLEYLDLSGNYFQGSSIPEFLGSMKQLRYLNLSGVGLGGLVPHQLGNLSSLRVLDLSGGDALYAKDLDWLSRLTSLQRLDLSGLELSQARNMMKALSMIPSLLELRMSGCGLNNIHLSHGYSNHTLANIQLLDLSENSFEGKVPYFLQQNFTSLKVLDLSRNEFNSSAPHFMHLKALVHLNLACNKFSHVEGGLSMILWNRCHMESLDLSGNGIEGEIFGPETGNFSAGCVAYDLQILRLGGNKLSGNLKEIFQDLDLRGNSFSGAIPSSLGKLFALEELDLSGNQLRGSIPKSLGRLMFLRTLRLESNQLNGTIPSSLGLLSNLEFLDISSNSLAGVVSEVHFANMSLLKTLRTEVNPMLTFEMQPGWIPPFQLENIVLGSCKIGPLFPSWLQTQRNVNRLDLSNASISGTLPIWLRTMNLSFLSLSHNYITGPISNIPPSINLIHLEILLLNDNLLNGSIPETLCKISSGLEVLDLSRNRLHGEVPNCWKNLESLTVVMLSSNRLTGLIPSSFGHLSSLKLLHLNDNGFRGELPFDLRNCTSLLAWDVGENGLSGNIPKWIGENLTQLNFLRLHKNMFSGRIPSELCQLQDLQILDLASNKLIGKIPRCFVNLTAMAISEAVGEFFVSFSGTQWLGESMMQVIKGLELEYTKTLGFVINMDLSSNNLVGEIPEELTALSKLIGLNLSHNKLSGRIPEQIGDMKSLNSLDFSSNNLSGVIPMSLAKLTALSFLNLSYNDLSGRIPSGNQLQTLTDPSIYAGNIRLCGAPLTKKCPGDEFPRVPSKQIHEEEEAKDSEKVWFYLDVMGGFATGFWGVVGILLLKKSWRWAFFRFVEATIDGIVVAISVRMAKLKRR